MARARLMKKEKSFIDELAEKGGRPLYEQTPAAETRVQRPRRGVDETGFPVRRRRAGTAAGRTCRQRRSAGLHENRERFLGCTAGIAIFARLGQRPPRRHTGLGTAPPGYGNGNGL